VSTVLLLVLHPAKFNENKNPPITVKRGRWKEIVWVKPSGTREPLKKGDEWQVWGKDGNTT